MRLMRQSTGLDALASEYEAVYRDARGNLRLAYGIDHANPCRPLSAFGPGFREKIEDLPRVETRVSADDGTDTPVIHLD